jgi:hypothetical protein
VTLKLAACPSAAEDRLDNLTAIFARMKGGDIEGRVVMRISDGA